MSTREDDFADEIEAHIALETDRLIADGLSPDDAARAARRTFGNVTSVRERHYEARRRLWLDHLAQDLRAAARSLVRYPVVSAVAILSLSAGIAATTASLTLRDVIFQNPPRLYRDPQQLSKVQVNRQDRPIRPAGSYVPGDLYVRWTQTGTNMAAWLWNARKEYALSHAISAWLLTEALAVGDTEAIELCTRNVSLSVPTRLGNIKTA